MTPLVIRQARCTALAFQCEGGSQYTDNPKDRGGPTKFGVTLVALSEFRGHPVSAADVMALTEAEALRIYDVKYWDAVRGDILPAGVDMMVFDAAVNTGRKRAVRLLQGGLRVEQDGDFGFKTLAALEAVTDVVSLIERLRLARVAYYRSLDDFPTFGRGWLNRVQLVAVSSAAWARKG